MAMHGFNGVHRDEWTNGVTAGRLRKAAQAKVTYHKGRVTYWTKQRDAAKKKFEKHGMKLVENPQFGANNVQPMSAYTSNKVRSAEVDYDLAEKWQRYNAKVEQHKAKVREFSKWDRFLDPKMCESNSGDDSMLELTIADMTYFGMGENPDPSED